MDAIEYTDADGEVRSPPKWDGAPENLQAQKNQLLQWIDHSEIRSSIVPRLYDQDWENVRDTIEGGALGLPTLVRPSNGKRGIYSVLYIIRVYNSVTIFSFAGQKRKPAQEPLLTQPPSKSE